MITLKTLSDATAQEVFDQVATHLLHQRQRSMRKFLGLGCAYRGNGGLKCAAGCLIADDEYDPHMEGRGWSDLFLEGAVPIAHFDLISQLQVVHDSCSPALWAYHLASLADELHLKMVQV